MTSDSRIAAARKLSTNVRERELDTDKELPVSRDTWPGDLEAFPTNDTIPTPPPSSGTTEHLTIPALPPLPSDDDN
jgi:hypothetical protein